MGFPISELKVKVLSLNVWGLPDCLTKLVYRKYKDAKVSGGRSWTNRRKRMSTIASRICEFDVVCLQEVWLQEDQELFAKMGLSNGLIYSHVFSSGMIGSSGLQILSRYPIKEVSFHRYRVNGQVLRVDQGDYHAGKGFGLARIQVSESQTISVINTHTIASYQSKDAYIPDRLSQVWEIIRFVQMTSQPDQPIVVCGDMNCSPESLEYELLTQVGKLSDSFLEMKKLQNTKSCTKFNHKNESTTICGALSSTDSKPHRIDYILYQKSKGIRLSNYNLVLDDSDFLYSDHFGICSTFVIDNNAKYRSRLIRSKLAMSNEVDDEYDEDEVEIIAPKLQKDILKQCSDQIFNGTKRAQNRKTNHLIRCLLSFMILCMLVFYSSPSHYVGFICIYMVVEFLIGMFVVENEIAALSEAHKEIKYFIS